MYRQLIAFAALAPVLASAQTVPALMKLKCWDSFHANRAPGSLLSFEAEILPPTSAHGGGATLKLFKVLSKEGIFSKVLSKSDGEMVSALVSYHHSSYNFYDIGISWAARDLLNKPGLIHLVSLSVDFPRDSRETTAQGTYTSSVQWAGQNSFPVSCKAVR